MKSKESKNTARGRNAEPVNRKRKASKNDFDYRSKRGKSGSRKSDQTSVDMKEVRSMYYFPLLKYLPCPLLYTNG